MPDDHIQLKDVVGEKIAYDFLAYNRIILPEVIEDNDLSVLQRLLHHHTARDKRILIFCAGQGGNNNSARGIVDLIREHGRCDGILLGVAYSSHSVIWAACQRRYFYPMAQIGVHQVYYSYSERTEFRESEFENQSTAAAANNMFIASVYASASNKSTAWWREQLPEGGISKVIGTATLLTLQMGLPIAERVTHEQG